MPLFIFQFVTLCTIPLIDISFQTHLSFLNIPSLFCLGIVFFFFNGKKNKPTDNRVVQTVVCFPRVLLNYQGTCGTDPPWMLIKHVSTPWKDGNLVSVIAPHVKHGVPETKAMGLF